MIHIVTHCYAGLLPQYAEHLRYQLASLILHPPTVPFGITVCLSITDQRTIDVVNQFRDNFSFDELPLITNAMPNNQLFRRSIGRNQAAIETKADLVWFTDVDHVFHELCLDRLWEVWNDEKGTLVYPKTTYIHKEHSIGDETIEQASDELLPAIKCSDFVPTTNRRAIGGIQIVDGKFCRKYGYLDQVEKYQRPRKDATKPFPDFRDDVAFRSYVTANGGTIKRIDFGGLFRIRHTRTTYQGQVHEAECLDQTS